MKRLFLCLGLILMVVFVLTACGEKEEGTPGLTFFPRSDGNYVVSAGEALYLDEIVIPSQYKDGKVVEIAADAFANANNLRSITIPNTVKTVGINAFQNCTSLSDVYITDITAWCQMSFGNGSSTPFRYAQNLYLNGEILTELMISDEVTSINDMTFYGCKSLTSVTIPNSVTSIGARAFYGCENLKSITVPNSVSRIGYEAFSRCNRLETVTLPFVGESPDSENTHFGYIFGASASYYNADYVPSSLRTVIVTGGTYIDEYAFRECESISNVTLPSSITGIGVMAFHGCSSLVSINIPDGVTRIEQQTFQNCSSLASITLPSGIQFISMYAFKDCISLTDVSIPEQLQYISGDAFEGCTGLDYNEYNNAIYLGSESNPYFLLVKAKSQDITSCEIHPETKVIGDSAFYSCWGLTSITVPYGVTYINTDAFCSCINLESVIIPNSVTSIGSSTVGGCQSLTSITLPNSVTSISTYAFWGCRSLETIVIPSSVAYIGVGAFENCNRLVVSCEVEKQPAGWDADWNGGTCVEWGYRKNN